VEYIGTSCSTAANCVYTMKGDGTKSKNGTLSPEAAAKAAIRILGDGTAGIVSA
jgi:hypothetical protein